MQLPWRGASKGPQTTAPRGVPPGGQGHPTCCPQPAWLQGTHNSPSGPSWPHFLLADPASPHCPPGQSVHFGKTSLLTLTSLLVCQPCRNRALQASSISLRLMGGGGSCMVPGGHMWDLHRCMFIHVCPVGTAHMLPLLCGVRRYVQGVCVPCVCCAHKFASTSNMCLSLPSSFL